MENNFSKNEPFYIATPHGVIEDTFIDLVEFPNCIIVSGTQNTVVFDMSENVYLRTTGINGEKLEEGEDCISIRNIVQKGSMDLIRVFSDKEKATVFAHNAETLVKLRMACEIVKLRMACENENEKDEEER